MKKTEQNRLFGTDGIRSEYGTYPLDRDSILKLGYAIGELFPGANLAAGRDTRESGEEILGLLAAGIGGRAKIRDCGVLPTPGLSYTTEQGNYDYGIMVTASHNPWTDNGIKIFNGNGEKLPDSKAEELETIFFNLNKSPDTGPVTVPGCTEAVNFYRESLVGTATGAAGIKKQSLKIVLDCANGATYNVAPDIFRRAGFDPVVVNASPDGKNINLDCGSMHLEPLKQTVSERKADLGIAFDGDGDRVLMVDGSGNQLDGDHVLYIISRYLSEPGSELHDKFNRVVVGTVMSNLGLEKALERMDIRFIRSDVGDRHVYREMKERDVLLGGEQSGHTILRAFRRSGDGILTALYFLKSLFHLGISVSDVSRELRLYPQLMRSIRIREKRAMAEWDELLQLQESFEARHGENSRVLIRYSGTEPKIRVMMESADQRIIDENFHLFEELIKTTIGKGV